MSSTGPVLTNTWYVSEDPRSPDFELREWGHFNGREPLQIGHVYMIDDRDSQEHGPVLQVAPGQPAPQVGVPFWMRNPHYRLSLWDALRPR